MGLMLTPALPPELLQEGCGGIYEPPGGVAAPQSLVNRRHRYSSEVGMEEREREWDDYD